MDRKRSTVFRLTLAEASGPVATAYYKAPFFTAERQGSRNLERARTAILNSETMGTLFAEATTGSGISINETLALDPETLEVVTLGLEGRPFGIPLSHSLTRGRREEALITCRRVGRAVRIVEGLPAPESGPELERIWQETERKLEAVGPLLPDGDRRSLEQSLRGLYESATGDTGGVSLAHGDLSPDNLIMMKDGTGLIDFMWIPQLRGFDLSRFVHRLRYTTPSSDRWARSLTEAVLEGYGDATAPSQPGWRFSEMQSLLGTIQHLERKGEGGRRSAGRALAEIRAGL
jgi:Phosphotransferase enzyme family